MTQTLALLLDAYRELNARKLFWVSLALSVAICLALALVGQVDGGYQLLWFESLRFGEGLPPETFYVQQLFYMLGYKAWLTFGAGAIAVISTAGLFPDFIREGAIDTVLSKPIGRLRLFLTKWACGLLFVFLQITVFTVGCFLVIGVRGGVWAFSMLWAIPLTVLFFSYLFSVSVLVGVVTRSSIVALIVTLLVWAPIIVIDFTERNVLLPMVVQQAYKAELIKRDGIDAYLPIDNRMTITGLGFEPMPEIRPALVEADLAQLESATGWGTAQQILYSVKTVLPKTGETTSYLQRFMYPDRFEAGQFEQMADAMQWEHGVRWDPALAREVSARFTSNRGVVWVIGSSVLFELICLGLAGWVFCRRDY